MRSYLFVLFAAVLALCHCPASAQQSLPVSPPDSIDLTQPSLTLDAIQTYQRSHIDSEDTVEGGGESTYKTFDILWSGRVDRNDSSGLSMFRQYAKNLLLDAQDRAQPPSSQAKLTSGVCGSSFAGAWQCIGPAQYTQVQKMGFITCTWADPSVANGATVLAGTGGGLFKTTNSGANWNCLTDGTPVAWGLIAVNSIAVRPGDPQVIFLGTSNQNIAPGTALGQDGRYGASILYSTTGGQTWTVEAIPDGGPVTDADYAKEVQGIYFSPSGNKLFALQGKKVFQRNYPTGTWTEITPAFGYNIWEWNDIIFKSGTTDEFVLSASSYGDANSAVANNMHSTLFYRQLNSGLYNWIDLTAGLSLTPTTGGTLLTDNIRQLEVSCRDANRMYVMINKYNNLNNWGVFNLLQYNFASASWSIINQTVPDLLFNRTNDFTFGIVSDPNSPDVIYLGEDVPQVSSDGGVTWRQIGEYGGVPTHGDIRSMFIHTSDPAVAGAANDVVLFATDGGVSIKRTNRNPATFGASTTENMSQFGPMANTFFGVGSSEAGNIKLAGAAHNGYSAHEPNQALPWLAFEDGDAYSTYFDKGNRTVATGQSSLVSTIMTGTQSLNGRVIGGSQDDNDLPGLAPNLILTRLPFKVDEANNHIAGINQLVTRTGVFTSWSPNTLFAGISTSSLITCMDFVPYNTGGVLSSIGWVANRNGDLYFRNGTGNFVFTSYVNQAPHKISDLCIDPTNASRVWLARRGVNTSSSAKNRVTYSPDAGSNWYDLSKGLPKRLPVTSIVFREGTQELFAATDVGIYKIDMACFAASQNDANGVNTSVEWKLFSKGATGLKDFPNVAVTDLEINYCSGQLLASTYGRSIWSTPLFDPLNINPPEQTTVITSTPTQAWTGNRYIAGGIRIKSGATLTISGTTTRIFMPSEGQIYVEPGAQLIVDGATLTNGCASCMWGGIVGEGKQRMAQTASNQARIIIRNGATIEHARNAITTWAGDWYKSGAIVSASGSTFRNNRRAIEFMAYYNSTNAVVPSPNASRIFGCSFVLNNDYKGTAFNYPFSTFVSLWETAGVVFTGNTFTNTNNSASNFSAGIRSYNASYSLVPGCNSQLYPCNNYIYNVFTGLRHGIEAEGDALDLNTISVDRAKFYTCGAGVFARNLQNAKVIRSQFYVGNTVFPYIGICNNNYGIRLLEGCNGSIVEQNSFVQGASGNGTDLYGVTVENTGYNAKTSIYGNTFSNMSYAVLGAGANGSYNNHGPYYFSDGAKIECNTFTSNYEDITIATNSQIQTEQGSVNQSAGNTFQTGGKLLNNSTNLLKYYHTGGNTLPQIITGTNPYQINTAHTCPVHYTDGPRVPDKVPYQVFNAAVDGLNVKVSEWNGLIDGGSTPSVLSAINNTTSATEDALRGQLLTLSPFVSEAALRAVAAGARLPLEKYMDVLQANPDVLRHLPFMDYLASGLEDPLPEDAIETLQETSETITERGIREAELQEQYDSLLVTSADWINTIAIDSTGAELDSIPSIYARTPSLPARYSLAAWHLLHGVPRYCDSVMVSISTEFQLTPNQNAEYLAYDSLWTVLKTVDLSRRDADLLTDLQRTQLTSLSTGYNAAASTARSILTTRGGEATRQKFCSYYLPVLVGLRTTANDARSPRPGQKTPAATANQVTVLPNPANDVLAFKYNLIAFSGEVTLRLSNASGTVVRSATLPGKSGKIEWDVRALSAGTYLYQLSDQKRTLAGGKVIIVH